MANPNPKHKWKKGQSGNPNGRPKGITITELIRQKLPLEEVAEITAEHIRKGNIQILKEFWDRIEGKVKEQIAVEGVKIIFEDKTSKDE